MSPLSGFTPDVERILLAAVVLSMLCALDLGLSARPRRPLPPDLKSGTALRDAPAGLKPPEASCGDAGEGRALVVRVRAEGPQRRLWVTDQDGAWLGRMAAGDDGRYHFRAEVKECPRAVRVASRSGSRQAVPAVR